ncbi:hypothetical protein QJS10_CPB04g00011 [Acorus calamus]|uniref:Helicase C-terminal domain-containing protein n=1 Tax=Acorus calamus TaxID=4465 RepID=A0AAV9F0Z1_ACOCL|nr:hypothetical protein QJS10_CPB04g00011 [Acorus calamus]
MELLWKMLKGKMRPRCATFENLVESLSLADRAGDALRVLDAMYKAGYVLGTSLCHSLVGRLCSENHQHAGEHLEEVLGRDDVMLPRKQNIHFKGVKMSYEPRNLLGVKDLRCIIFVERVFTAIVLQSLLSHVQELLHWKTKYTAGNHSGLQSQSRREQINIVDAFRDGKVNIIVATQILEEGLDVQSCNLVIRFDP